MAVSGIEEELYEFCRDALRSDIEVTLVSGEDVVTRVAGKLLSVQLSAEYGMKLVFEGGDSVTFPGDMSLTVREREGHTVGFLVPLLGDMRGSIYPLAYFSK